MFTLLLQGVSSSDDSDDDLSTEDNSGRDKKLTWEDIEKDLGEPPDELLDLKKVCLYMKYTMTQVLEEHLSWLVSYAVSTF